MVNMFNRYLEKDKIYESWRFEYINGRKTYNISEKIKKLIDDNMFLNIGPNFNYKNLIKSKNLNIKEGYLKISNSYNKNWEPVTIKASSPLKIYLGNTKNNIKNIEIVYFFNAEISPCYLKLLNDQLRDLLKSNILSELEVNLYCIIICENKKKQLHINKLFKDLNLKNYCKLEILYKNNHHKEYEGIYKVWSISKKNNSNLVIYLHGKGISYLSNRFFYIRQPIEKLIFRLIIRRFKKNIEIMYRIKSISKIGILSGGNGWLWFNFWIARKSYLTNIEKPIKTNRACYYEDWLGRLIIKENDKNKIIYKNEFGDRYQFSLDETFSILYSTKNKKYNIGSFCKVEKGGFVGLGLTKYKYKLWYFFLVILNKLRVIKGDKDKFRFY